VYSERVAGSTAADLARRRANLERLSQQQRLETDAAARRVQERQAQPPEPAHEADLVNLRNQAALLEASYTSTLRNYQDVLSLELLAVRDGVEVLEQAIPPLRPIRPNYAVLTLLAVVAGTALATALALAREYLDDTLADAERVRLRLDLPTLGTVSSAGADYELLAGRCRALLPDRLIPSAVVAGATAVERSSIVAVNLAIALAHFGHQVLLVDVDSPETSAARNLGAADDKRAANGHAADVPGYTLNTTQVPGLSVLVSATPNNDESALALKAQLEQLPSDTVVFDAPAVLDRPHAAVIASYVDFVVLVVDPRRSSARATDRAVRNLRAVGAQILGVVLNLHPETVLERKPVSDRGHVDAMRRKRDRRRVRVPLGDGAP
jgi:tyrosine-protein kinase Etk/Wzc